MKCHGQYYSTDYNHNSKQNHGFLNDFQQFWNDLITSLFQAIYFYS